MTEELQELYQSIIIDHNKSPRNYGLLEDPTHRAEGYNPICGDKVELSLRVDSDTIEAITFEAASCAICKASASLMTRALSGKKVSEVGKLESALLTMLAGKQVDEAALGVDSELLALSGVSKFPARIKCAQLPWETYRSALQNKL